MAEKNELLQQAMAANVGRVSRVETQVVVMSKLLDATLPRLTPLQCMEVEKAFRNGIEDVMAYVDEFAMSGQYHSTLAELTNLYLAALRVDRNRASASSND
ncbi:hypothetical protein FAZ69_13495 [Trinickia terrae]|uniref:Uncharacterized protein n=1 Tax=Trinickia terrae TaxID=2571161 RepID=A0A4U1I5X9_9BURK|nr:hypothetical protein [Trinickia terrae]TKC88758.1 hypothetical protein FAZ69_13495 [Trinickia terrae]